MLERVTVGGATGYDRPCMMQGNRPCIWTPCHCFPVAIILRYICSITRVQRSTGGDTVLAYTLSRSCMTSRPVLNGKSDLLEKYRDQPRGYIVAMPTYQSSREAFPNCHFMIV
jgi:hypothetical protein